jgi:hypothetical protein
MGRRTRVADNLSIRYVVPAYASEEERQTAIARANDALKRLAQLHAARDALRSATNDEALARSDS